MQIETLIVQLKREHPADPGRSAPRTACSLHARRRAHCSLSRIAAWAARTFSGINCRRVSEGAICLGSEVEVTLGQAVDLVRPDLHLALAPRDRQVRMMTSCFCDVGHLVGKGHRFHEVLKSVFALEVTFGVQKPAIVQLSQELFGTVSSIGGTPPRHGTHFGRQVSSSTSVQSVCELHASPGPQSDPRLDSILGRSLLYPLLE